MGRPITPEIERLDEDVGVSGRGVAGEGGGVSLCQHHARVYLSMKGWEGCSHQTCRKRGTVVSGGRRLRPSHAVRQLGLECPNPGVGQGLGRSGEATSPVGAAMRPREPQDPCGLGPQGPTLGSLSQVGRFALPAAIH